MNVCVGCEGAAPPFAAFCSETCEGTWHAQVESLTPCCEVDGEVMGYTARGRPVLKCPGCKQRFFDEDAPEREVVVLQGELPTLRQRIVALRLAAQPVAPRSASRADALDRQGEWVEQVLEGMMEVLQAGWDYGDADLAAMSLEELERHVGDELQSCDGPRGWADPPPRSLRPLVLPRVAARIRELARSRLRAWQQEDPEGYACYMERRAEDEPRMDPREAALADAAEASYPEDWFSDS